MGEALFTTSWDDGHPLDLRIAELLAKHGFAATFYVPGLNSPGGVREGFPVLSCTQLRELGNSFEIGSHTLTHQYLDEVDVEEAKRQIVEGKRELESQLGRAVAGFCYPGGKYSAHHAKIVREANFNYARTVANLEMAAPTDLFSIATTLQFYPHDRGTYLKNYVKNGHWHERAGLLMVAMSHSDLKSRLHAAMDYVFDSGGIFHLWGHSLEIERFNGWTLLDDVLRHAAERIARGHRFSNGGLLEYLDKSPRWRAQNLSAVCPISIWTLEQMCDALPYLDLPLV